jgi:hypothetical protein
MSRRPWRVCAPCAVLLMTTCGGASTDLATPVPTAAPLRAPSVSEVKTALITAADVAGSRVGEAPTDGNHAALVRDGLVPTPCLGAAGITAADRSAVGTDVSQPLSYGAAQDVTETAVIESTPRNTELDMAQAMAGARACPAAQIDPGGKFADREVSTSTATLGSWTGTRTGALNTFSTGVKRVASYVYFLSRGGGLLLLQLGIAFANVTPSVHYQQEADQLATRLVQRLTALR